MAFMNPILEENWPSLIEYLSVAIGKEVKALRAPPEPTTGGIENRNYYIYAKTDEGDVDFVLRCEPETIPQWRQSYDLYDLHREYLVLKELLTLNLKLKTPQVWGFDDGVVFGVSSFLMACLPGEHLKWTLDSSYSDELVLQLADAIAYISEINYEGNDWLKSHLPVRTMESDLAWLDAYSREYVSDPLMNYALSWLRERCPVSRSLVLCHGDPNPQNFLQNNGVIDVAIDWEFACLRDDPLGELICVGGWLVKYRF